MIVKRIETFLAETKMSPSLFADAIGVQRATISHILSGRNNPSLDFVQKILSRFSKLSPDWILSGKGDIWRGADNNESTGFTSGGHTGNVQQLQPALFDIPAVKNAPGQKADVGSKTDTASVSAGKRILQEMVLPASSKVETPVSGHQTKKIQKIIVLYSDQTFEAYTEF
jgi:DNA-binding XRE family transcriptional regulator